MTNIIDIIKKLMEEKQYTAAQLSREIGVKQSSVYNMLNRKTVQVSKLVDISKAMQYNFFREISQQLPFENPVYDAEIQQVKEELNHEITGLKQQIAQLIEENKVLQTKTTTLETVIEKLGR